MLRPAQRVNAVQPVFIEQGPLADAKRRRFTSLSRLKAYATFALQSFVRDCKIAFGKFSALDRGNGVKQYRRPICSFDRTE
jgi:hypothetical protein